MARCIRTKFWIFTGWIKLALQCYKKKAFEAIPHLMDEFHLSHSRIEDIVEGKD